MTDQQLYFAIGVPVILNLLALLWQSRAVEKTLGARIDVLSARIDSLDKGVNTRIDYLEKVMNAKFDAVYARFDTARQELLRVEEVLDARLKHLEDEKKAR